MRRLFLKSLVSVVALSALGTSLWAKDDYKLTLKLSHVFSPEEQLSKSMDEVAKNIYDKTKGAINIQTFGQGQLATYKDGVEQVARGAKFISVEDPSYIGDYVPDFKALVGPMLYDSYDEYTTLIQDDMVKDMIKQAEAKGIKILALDYIFGFRNLITKKEIKSPADLKGVKLRTPGSNLFIDTINAMGATATSLPFGETISAVQQGVVDGLEGSVFTIEGTKLYETPAKRVALTKHFLGTCGVYISTKVWKDIPAKYQAIIQEEFTAGAKRMIAKMKSQVAGVTKGLEAKGVVFNKVNRDEFTKATAKVYKEIKGLTPGVYDKIVSKLQAMRK